MVNRSLLLATALGLLAAFTPAFGQDALKAEGCTTVCTDTATSIQVRQLPLHSPAVEVHPDGVGARLIRPVGSTTPNAFAQRRLSLKLRTVGSV
jgi:hypothetical protein